MRLTITWSAANGERIPSDLLPARGEIVPLLHEDGFQYPATVVAAAATARKATLVLKADQAAAKLPGLT
jgi:hypothetical protein